MLKESNLISRALYFLSAFAVLTACGLRGGAERNDLYVIEFGLDDSAAVSLMADVSPTGVVINNGGESINLTHCGDGCYGVPVFGGAIRGSWIEDVFYGVWIDSLRPGNFSVPLKISPRNTFINVTEVKDTSISSWATSLGRLNLKQFGDSVLATVLTPTGDYRYLSGVMPGGELDLGTFDGAHLFHFSATIKGDSMVDGVFKSGTHYTGAWSGVRGGVEVSWSGLQSANAGEEVVFSGVRSDGGTERWTRDRIRREGKKMLVVDVMGTWCPNCLDEARLLLELRELYPDVLFLSVAFERGGEEVALKRLSAFKDELGIGWDMLYGGGASKVEADSVMKFIGGVMSFPTTAFIPLSGPVVVHTGFSGPATGKHYESEVEFFKSAIEEMLSR